MFFCHVRKIKPYHITTTRGEMVEFLRDLVGAERAKSKKVQAFVEECYRRLQMDKE